MVVKAWIVFHGLDGTEKGAETDLIPLGIRVRLGLQPSAGASGRGGAEIDQQRFLRRRSFRERRVCVLVPVDGHLTRPPELKLQQNLPPLS